MTYKNLTLFLKIDGNLWQNQYRANVFRCTVCFVVGCVATVFLAGSSKLVTCRIHLPRLRLDCGVWSFYFWTHLPAYTRSHRHINKQQILLRAKPFKNMLCSFRPETVSRKLQHAKWTCILPDTHATTHTQVHTLKYLYRHTAFLILDALAYTQGDLWGWLPLVLCVSLAWYYLVSKPQLSTETESWSGDRGNERGWKIEGKGVVRK